MIHVEASDIIDSRPEDLYAIFADYKVSHPAILPKSYFTDLTVEQGGVGAGTIVQVHMAVMGAKRHYRFVVSEPEPGRVLVETDEAAGVVTKFIIEPLNGGNQSRVTLSTDTRPSPGLAGIMEKVISPPITRRIYKQELHLLAEYAREHVENKAL
jgi:DNA-directed RNA polymerase subunit H (RpoH/RPB5)